MPALPTQAVDRVLETWPVGILATINADGTPHLVPIVFACVNGTVWSSVDGKPKRGTELKRLGNIRRDARVSVLLERYADEWSRLWWVRLSGRAAIVDGDALRDHALAHSAAEALRAKYPQYGATELFSGPPTLLCITVERIVSWCADPACWSIDD